MIYKVIGLMSGSSLDGLDIAYVHLQEAVSGSGMADKRNRKWEYHFQHTVSYPYAEEWKIRLASASGLKALDYLLLHAEYGRYVGEQVLRFIREYALDYQVQLIVSHGHTVFHLPGRRMTAQLGDGATIAAVTGINVVSDLRALDVALGGQGAPIVPIGERMFFPGYDLFLNLGGIANLSVVADGGHFSAWDVSPANRVLNALAGLAGKDFDDGGAMAAGGMVKEALLQELNGLSYYAEAYPKSLANEFGTDIVLPMLMAEIDGGSASIGDALRTFTEHVAVQVVRAVALVAGAEGKGNAGPVSDGEPGAAETKKMLVTGGGVHNRFLTERLRALLAPEGVELVVPDVQVVDFKEALVMALIGVLRWREENNVLASVTGARRDSIGGAVWMGE